MIVEQTHQLIGWKNLPISGMRQLKSWVRDHMLQVLALK
jgi:hypothetical protein